MADNSSGRFTASGGLTKHNGAKSGETPRERRRSYAAAATASSAKLQVNRLKHGNADAPQNGLAASGEWQERHSKSHKEGMDSRAPRGSHGKAADHIGSNMTAPGNGQGQERHAPESHVRNHASFKQGHPHGGTEQHAQGKTRHSGGDWSADDRHQENNSKNNSSKPKVTTPALEDPALPPLPPANGDPSYWNWAEGDGTDGGSGNNPFAKFASAEDYYRAFAEGGRRGETAALMLEVRNFFSAIFEDHIDPLTGALLPMDLLTFLDRAASSLAGPRRARNRDRLFLIAKHCSDAAVKLCADPDDMLLRGHEVLPVRQVRELDSASTMWLSRQPGRNLHEKLVSNPHLKAVIRFVSVDTPENELLKAFISRMHDLLVLRRAVPSDECGDSACEGLFNLGEVWLHSETASRIGRWKNLPPNNTLLSDKRYRKIWDGWIALKLLDGQIESDCQRLDDSLADCLFLSILACLSRTPGIRILQQPFGIDEDNLSPWTALKKRAYMRTRGSPETGSSQLLADLHSHSISLGGRSLDLSVKGGILSLSLTDGRILKRLLEPGELGNIAEKAACEFAQIVPASSPRLVSGGNYFAVDTSMTVPGVSSATGQSAARPLKLLCQEWTLPKSDASGEQAKMLIDCSTASAINMRKGVRTASMRTVLYGTEDGDIENRGPDALFIAGAFRSWLEWNMRPNGPLEVEYVVPDDKDEFALRHLRQAFNSTFEKAAPLPRSIAAAMSWLSSSGRASGEAAPGLILVTVTRIPGGAVLTPITFERMPHAEALGGAGMVRHPPRIIIGRRSKKQPEPEWLRAASRLFDQASLDKIKGSFSMLLQKNWVDITSDLARCAGRVESTSSITPEDIEKCLPANLKKYAGSAKVLLIDKVRLEGVPSVLDRQFVPRPSDGAAFHHMLQERNGGVPLWRDSLPDLYLKLGNEKIYLVRGQTIIPEKGRKVSIKVTGTFTIPAGKKKVSCPLVIGDWAGGRYVAQIRSSMLPFLNDVKCTLDLSYTYGADEPYSLRLIPIQSSARAPAGYIPVHLEDSENAYADLPFPTYPESKDWVSIQSEIDNFINYFKQYVNFSWDNRKQLAAIASGKLRDTEECFLNLSKLRGKMHFAAQAVWNGHSLSDPDCPYELSSFVYEIMPKVRNIVLSDTKGLDGMLEIKDAVAYTACCMQKDCYDFVYDPMLNEAMADPSRINKKTKMYANLMGDLSQPWQVTMFNILRSQDLDEPGNTWLAICWSLILWKGPNCIESIDSNLAKQLLRAASNICKISKKRLGAMFNKDEAKDVEKMPAGMERAELAKRETNNWTRALELVFALLRLRERHEKKLTQLLAPGSAFAGRFEESAIELGTFVWNYTKEYRNLYNGKRTFFTPRIEVKVGSKQQDLRHLPDMLYALVSYLRGDDEETGQIRIEGINEGSNND